MSETANTSSGPAATSAADSTAATSAADSTAATSAADSTAATSAADSTVRSGRPDAAAVIWDWKGERDDRLERARRARRGAIVRALVAAVAGGVFFFFGRVGVAGAAWGVGGLTLVLGLTSPLGAYAALERVVGKAGDLVGVVLTWLLLAPVYYLFFTPFGLLFKRGARDPMRRELSKDAETYWQTRDRQRALDKPY
jgi:hypothetical protein